MDSSNSNDVTTALVRHPASCARMWPHAQQSTVDVVRASRSADSRELPYASRPTVTWVINAQHRVMMRSRHRHDATNSSVRTTPMTLLCHCYRDERRCTRRERCVRVIVAAVADIALRHHVTSRMTYASVATCTFAFNIDMHDHDQAQAQATPRRYDDDDYAARLHIARHRYRSSAFINVTT